MRIPFESTAHVNVLPLPRVYTAPSRGVQPHGVRTASMRAHVKRLRWLVLVKAEPLVKRAFDIAVTLLVTPLLAPIGLLAGLLIRLTDGGPMLYWQKRVGRYGRVFAFPKLRSMVMNADALRGELESGNHHLRGVTFKIRRDPRVTRIGAFIRRMSIDELPQLWCVLVGDMSLVGPRPALPAEVERYSRVDRRRLDVTPGLTCLWQVSGRADLPFEKQVQLDVSYIQQHSLWMDLRILMNTVPAVLSGKGAY